MKRKIIFMLLACCAAALVSAQGMGSSLPGDQAGWNPPPAETVTVTGNLTVTQGTIAVKDGETTYLVPGLFRFVGFIDSLKDGAQVKLEGFAVNSPDSGTKILRATRLTIAGKEYETGRPAGANMMPGYGGFRGRYNGGGWQGGCPGNNFRGGRRR